MSAAAFHVGVNLLYLRPGQVGGSEVYARSLLRAMRGLAGDGHEVELTVFTNGVAAPTFQPSQPDRPGASGPGLRVVTVDARPRFSQARRLVAENLALVPHLQRLRLQRRGVDVLWSPANFAAVGLPSRVPQVVTIHDLQHIHLPDHFSRGRRLARTVLMRASTRRAARVIAISEFTRADLVARGWADPARTVTILEGVDRLAPPDPARVMSTRARLGLEDPYVFFPAMMAPHKNHKTLLAAFARARRRLMDAGWGGLRLVLSGKVTSLQERLDAQAKSLGVSGAVRHLGFLDRQDLYDVLAGAQALVFPSRFEGFGLPPLEAMQCGTPVVASDAASLPEVVGDGGLLLDPSDAPAWADAIVHVCRDDALRADLVARGRAQVARFSWARAARETLDVLRAAAATRRPNGFGRHFGERFGERFS